MSCLFLFPTPPLQVSGSLGVQEAHAWGGGELREEEEKGKGVGCSPAGWGLCPEAFISFSKVGILGEVSGEGFSRIVISSPGVLFQGCGLHLLVSARAGGD